MLAQVRLYYARANSAYGSLWKCMQKLVVVRVYVDVSATRATLAFRRVFL